jgi:MFS transporter, DHA2 family, multidrug resistance protein
MAPNAVTAVPSASAPPSLSTAVATIGVAAIALMGSSVSSQLVDLAIADIGGAFSVSADEGSWIACIATMAEVAAIPIAALLVRALTFRVVVIGATGLYALAAFASLLAPSEDVLLPLRAAQSFCGGILSVLLFVVTVATLPAGSRRAIGLTVFGFASTAPAAVAASVGGFAIDCFGWQGLYYFDLSWALAVLGLACVLLHRTPSVMRLSEIDWIGYLPTAAGLAALILFMKQGDRFFWLVSPIIGHAGLLAGVFLLVANVVLLLRKQPLIDLSLLTKPSFGWAVTLATFYRFGLVMTAFVVPQTLMRLQGFRLPEIGDANITMLWAEFIAFPVAWFWGSRFDARLPLSCGLGLFAVGAFLCTRLTPAWQPGDFRLALLVVGFGQGLFLVPTVFYATRDVAPSQGPTAATLFNLSRVVGQTFGISVVGSLVTWRERFHSAVLVNSVNDANSAVRERFNGLVGTYLSTSRDTPLAQSQAWASLSSTVSNQAYVLAFVDAFVIIAMVLAVSAVLVFMLPPLHDTKTSTKTPALASGSLS